MRSCRPLPFAATNKKGSGRLRNRRPFSSVLGGLEVCSNADRVTWVLVVLVQELLVKATSLHLVFTGQVQCFENTLSARNAQHETRNPELGEGGDNGD